MQKYIHLVQIVETEKIAANQLRHQLEDQDTEIERLKSEVFPKDFFSLFSIYCHLLMIIYSIFRAKYSPQAEFLCHQQCGWATDLDMNL